MAKQRRAKPRPARKRAAARPARKARARPRPSSRLPAQKPSPPPPPPSVRPTYQEAVALYEQALHTLQRRHYDRAAEQFRAVLDRYPEERELHDRVRLYLRVCERQIRPSAPKMMSLGDRVYAATLALNTGDASGALGHLEPALNEAAESDHAQYVLAAIRAQRGEQDLAVGHLRRAIALNPENRSLARQDPDLEPLRGHEAFRSLVEAPGPARRRTRARAAR